jgi:hypothetical protein
MKKLLLILILGCFSAIAGAPVSNHLFIEYTAPIQPYETIWEAVCTEESSNRPYVINKKENAYGIVQIRQSRLDDYNRLAKKHYKLVDCLDPVKAKEIFLFFSQDFNPTNYKGIAKDWNKSKSDKYWKRVNKHLKC